MRLSIIAYTLYSLLLLALMSIPSHAQYNSLTATRLVQSCNSGVDNQPISSGCEFTNPATSGNCVIGVVNWANVPSSSVTIKDNAGNTLTNTSSVSSGSGQRMELFYGAVTATGTYYVQSQTAFTAEAYGIVMAEFPANTTSCTPDGSQVTTTTSGCTSCVQTLSGSITTSANGEVIVGADGGSGGDFTVGTPLTPAYLVGGTTTIGTMMSFLNAGAAGSYTISHQMDAQSPIGFAALAFQPPAQAISTTTLHDCALTQSYSDTVAYVGGTGSPTWSITSGSLPTGLSINSSSGAITGTCSGAVGTSTFTVSNGTVSKSLTITTRANFGNIVIGVPGTTGTGSPTSTFTATAGHTGLLIVLGWDSGTNSYLSTNTYVDNLGCGDIYTRMDGMPGFWLAGIQVYTTTFCASSNAAQVSWTNGASFGGSPLAVWVADVTAQPVLDASVSQGQFQLSSSGSFTTPNYTAPVPNGLLVAAAGSYCNNETLSLVSPFSTIFSGGGSIVNTCLTIGTASATTAGTYTATAIMTGSAGFYGASLDLFELRPMTGVPVTALTSIGDKRRRRPGN